MASGQEINGEVAQGVQAKGPTTFTLQVVSPSVAIPHGRLTFPGTAADMTVKQLKDKIRQSLDAKPSDQTQRLISRGRLLSRDNETMQEIFGDSLRTMDCQTLHLVLREANTSTPDIPYAASMRPTASASPRPAMHEHAHTHRHHHHDQPQVQGPQNRPPMPWANLTLGPTQAMNLPFGLNPQEFPQQQRQGASPQHAPPTAEQLAGIAFQQQLRELAQRQRERPAMGLNGVQDGQALNPRRTLDSQDPGRTALPFQQDNNTRTVVREGVAPNGQQWRITVNETVSGPGGFPRDPRTGAIILPTPQPVGGGLSIPANHLSVENLRAALRISEANQAATRAMTDAMRRNASTSSLPNLSSSQSHRPIPPGVTTSLNPSPARSATATPDIFRLAGQNMRGPTTQPQPPSSPSEVYILSSPEGPRAILVHGNLGTYYTPQSFPPILNPAMSFPRVSWPLPGIPIAPSTPVGQPQGTQETAAPQNQPQPQVQQVADPRGLPPLPQQQQQQQQQQAQVVPGQQPQHVQVRLQVRAVALGAIWPHIWMVIRLLLFIWWFLSPDASWSRWFTVITIAIALFLVNTGLLNPLAEQLRVPLRRHLENLMPLADDPGRAQPPPAAGVGSANAQAGDGANADLQPPHEPNPAETAARLVEQRRQANANWLMTQARRLERAGILFLASIAPGVAERHIARLEAAERQRQEAEAAAAAAAAAAEAARIAAENTDPTADDDAAADRDPVASATGAESESAAGTGDDARRREVHEAPVEPLVAV